MTTAASSCLAKAKERIRTMLANCTEFQTWTGASDATAAKSSIYIDGLPQANYNEDTDTLAYQVSLRPFAKINTSEENSLTVGEMVGASGKVDIWLEQNTPTDIIEEAERQFDNTIGKIMQSGDANNPGLIELSRTRQYEMLTKVVLAYYGRPTWEQQQRFGDCQVAVLTVDWGVTRG